MKLFGTDIEFVFLTNISEEVNEFIETEFHNYADKNGLELNQDLFCVAAQNKYGEIIGIISGIAYYHEVCIQTLIVKDGYRRLGLGRRMVKFIERTYKPLGYSIISVETYKFQSPGFYEKLGFLVDYVRSATDERLCKYYLSKDLNREA